MSIEDIKKAQEERAKKLRQQISEIKDGKISDSQHIKNPRDFIAEKMRELEEKEKQDLIIKNLEEDEQNE
ncbi:MAG: hypothetical protein ACR2MG_07995 [Pyrinomonadaceae bacterium]